MPYKAISARKRKRATLRRMYGNPWDSPKTRRSRSYSKSTTSSSHAAWRSVSSKR